MMAALYLPMDSWTTGPRITPPRPVRTARLSKHFALSARCRPLAMLAEEVRPGSLILVRHGQSTWNDENRFTGWANVPLNDKGREDAQDAADILLSEEALHIDVCYTSVLRRSVDTAKVILDAWEQAGHQRPETFARWRLNERHYGMLTGLNKREALGMFSKSELRHWRSSFEGKPPPMEPDHRHYSRTKERYELLLSARTQRKHEPKMTVLRQSDVPLTESLADTCRRVRQLGPISAHPFAGDIAPPSEPSAFARTLDADWAPQRRPHRGLLSGCDLLLHPTGGVAVGGRAPSAGQKRPECARGGARQLSPRAHLVHPGQPERRAPAFAGRPERRPARLRL